MASLRKIKVQAERSRLRRAARESKKLEHQRVADQEKRKKEFRKGIKQALGFDKIKIIGSKFESRRSAQMTTSHPLSTKWDRHY